MLAPRVHPTPYTTHDPANWRTTIDAHWGYTTTGNHDGGAHVNTKLRVLHLQPVNCGCQHHWMDTLAYEDIVISRVYFHPTLLNRDIFWLVTDQDIHKGEEIRIK